MHSCLSMINWSWTARARPITCSTGFSSDVERPCAAVVVLVNTKGAAGDKKVIDELLLQAWWAE